MKAQAIPSPAARMPGWQLLLRSLAVAAAVWLTMPAAHAGGIRAVESLGLSFLPNTIWALEQGGPPATFSKFDGTEVARFEMRFDGSTFHLTALNNNALASMPTLPWSLCLYPLTGDILPPGWDHSTSLGSIAWFDFPTLAGDCVDFALPGAVSVPEPGTWGMLAAGGLTLVSLAGRRAGRHLA